MAKDASMVNDGYRAYVRLPAVFENAKRNEILCIEHSSCRTRSRNIFVRAAFRIKSENQGKRGNIPRAIEKQAFRTAVEGNKTE